MALSTTINYDTEGNFTHDNTKTEFSGSLVRLLDKLPAGATFWHTFNTLNATVADGSVAHTVVGATPTLLANRMIAESSDIRAIKFDAASNFANTTIGAIEEIYKPDYSGTPVSSRFLFELGNDANNNNRIRCFHAATTGLLTFSIYTDAGVVIGEVATLWVPVAGIEYRFQGNWDVVNGAGAIRLFIDGVQLGPLITGTGTRTLVGVDNIWIGTNRTEAQASDAAFGYFIIYDSVQNTANHTPITEDTDQFAKSNPTVLVNSGIITDAILTAVETSSKTGSDEVKYTVFIAGQNFYWNGSAWVVSDGTYAQDITAAVLNTNGSHSSFPEGTVQIKAFLHSDDGSTRPTLTSLALTYSFFNTQADPPVCTIWGFYRDASGVGISGATVTFELVRSSNQYREASDAIIEKKIIVTTDSNGRFEADLIRTSAFETDGTFKMTITKSADLLSTTSISSGVKLVFSVPDLTDKNITDLLTSVA